VCVGVCVGPSFPPHPVPPRLPCSYSQGLAVGRQRKGPYSRFVRGHGPRARARKSIWYSFLGESAVTFGRIRGYFGRIIVGTALVRIIFSEIQRSVLSCLSKPTLSRKQPAANASRLAHGAHHQHGQRTGIPRPHVLSTAGCEIARDLCFVLFLFCNAYSELAPSPKTS
jgi:hypothetical protein